MGKKETQEKKTMAYAMVIEPMKDENGEYFCAYFPDLPGCTTMGDDLDDLQEKAGEAVEQHVQALADTNQPIPEPEQRVGLVNARVPVKKAG